MGQQSKNSDPHAPAADALSAETRSKYLDEFSSTVDRHRARGFEYEKEAIAYSTSALKVLSYLNGGALLAMPTAVALFKASVTDVKTALIAGAALFIAGLLCVALAQGCAFFTMAKRSESENHLASAQAIYVNIVYMPAVADLSKMNTEAAHQRVASSQKLKASDQWRFAGLVLFWFSLAAFVGGCLVGAHAILP